MENKYILNDSSIVLQEMIDNKIKVDCIITDPPYGISHKSNRSLKKDSITKKGIENDGSENIDKIEEIINLSNKVLNDNSHIYFFTRWDRISVYYPMLEKYFKLKNILIWDKQNHGSGDLLGAYGNRYECIIYGMKGRKILNEIDSKKRHQDILSFSKVPSSKLIHPHQKPLDLIKFLILKSTAENDIVLDMFSGIGTTLQASAELNRKAIAIEIDQFYYEEGIINLDLKSVDYERSLI